MLEERKTTIVQTFESVHNGPLQTLALLVRGVQDEQWTSSELSLKLQDLNQELRGLYNHMEDAALDGEEILLLQNQEVLSLQPPLDQLLHQVYTHMLERPFPGFDSLLIRLAPDFSVLEGQSFSFSEKRSFCLFLEEALTNVGKHGMGSVSLDVSCLLQDKTFVLRVINRLPHPLDITALELTGGQGTKQAQGLAKVLGGKFLRKSEGKSFICQLSWPKERSQSVWRYSLERLLHLSSRASDLSKQAKDNVS